MRFAPAQSLGCPPCSINFGPAGCTPCEPGWTMSECEGCFGGKEPGFFEKYEIWPAVVSGVIVAVATGVVMYQLNKRGLQTV